jgi:IS30 family transposase
MTPISLAPISERYLLFREREEIAISRELRRNSSTRTYWLEYRASMARWHRDRRASRPKVAKLAANEALRDYVQERFAGMVTVPSGEPVADPTTSFIGRRHGRRQDRRWAKSWSPQQIAQRLHLDFPHNESTRISHEAIYQALYVQGRGALKRELVACLRIGRALRVPQERSRKGPSGLITPEVMISERPAEAND